MTKFLATAEGYVSVAHIVSVSPHWDNSEIKSIVHMSNGSWFTINLSAISIINSILESATEGVIKL